DHLVHAHAAFAFEPRERRRLLDREVAANHVEEELPALAERLVDSADDVRVLFFLEVAEARAPAIDAVERVFERHLAHVALHEVDLLVLLLRLFAGAREHREAEVEADDRVAATRELDGLTAGA